MSNIKALENVPEIDFIESRTLEQVKGDLITDFQKQYEALAGQAIVMAEGDPYRLILYAAALQIYQGLQYIDRAGKQNLLKYSYAEYLENLGALRGVSRLPAAYAVVTLRFSLQVARPSAVIIPEGTRVTGQRRLYFATTAYAEIPAGQTFVDVQAKCLTAGADGNAYAIGELNTLVDPIGYVAAVSNTTVPEGGANVEDDASLAQRIYLAPSSYSVAGPVGAYEYWVHTFSASVEDVKVTTPTPGTVAICFLLTGGELPGETIIQDLENFLHDGTKVPLTDNLVITAPTTENYDINLTYYINRSDSAQAVSIQAAVTQAIGEYITWQQRIGRDVNPSELTRRIVAAGAKRVAITAPVFTAISATAVAQLGTQTVTYGGLEDD